MTSNNPIIEVKNLKFAYRSNELILKGISFSIARGDFVAVTGPSGSGKSTLFYLIGCLIDRYEGEVFINGTSTKNLEPNEKSWLRNSQIGFVFQQFYLLPRATVLENILLPTHFPYDNSFPSSKDKQRAHDIAAKLGISQLLDRSPQELSGGQQQRVAIARALLRKSELILADEPTGNLDSKSSESVMELLKQLHAEGHTVVIVTHSPEIAKQCDRVIRVKDGVLETDIRNSASSQNLSTQTPQKLSQRFENSFSKLGVRSFFRSLPGAWLNIQRSRTKSLLTMLGVSLGVAAVLSTMSLGSFAKKKILEGYQSLGINTLRFIGYENWVPGINSAPASFKEFSVAEDIAPLTKVFKEVEAVSPYADLQDATFEFSGRSLKESTAVIGIGEKHFHITGQNLLSGRSISLFDVSGGTPVCVIGSEVRNKLFPMMDPLKRSINIKNESYSISMSCRVIGVLEHQPSSQNASSPNSQVFIPYTYFAKAANHPSFRTLNEFLVKVQDKKDPAELGKQLEGYFFYKYGSSGYFRAASDAKLISQMKLFLNVFSGLLTTVAIIALMVGGVGINNMMLASMSERIKELGLRKALGATPRQLRYLMLSESVLLCTAAGVLGLGFGFIAYQGLVFAATKLITKLEYEWIFEPMAFVLSFLAIFITGLSSGFVPALKAEKLDVMEALRQDI